MYTAIVRRVVRTDQNNDVFVLLNDGKVTSIHAATIPTEAFFWKQEMKLNTKFLKMVLLLSQKLIGKIKTGV